jgi:hypothetical protein
MVFNVLGDNLLALIKAYHYGGIPSLIVRRVVSHVLEALLRLPCIQRKTMR